MLAFPRAATLLTLLLHACSPDAPDPAPAPQPAAPAAPAAAPALAPPAAPTPRPDPPRTSRCSAHGRDGSPIPAEGHVPLEQYFEVPARATCKLSRDDLVLRLHGPARVLALPHGEAGLLLREGIVEVDLAAGRATPESGFWLSTPGVRVELVQGARLVVRAMPGGGSRVYVVSGQARAQPLGRGEAARPVAAGSGLAISNAGKATAIDQRYTRVEDVVAWMSRPPRPDGRPGLDELVAIARDTLAEVEAARARLDALTRDHEQRVASGAPGAMELQRQIATESGGQLAAQRLLRAQEAALETWTLDPGVRGGEAARELLERIHAR